MKRCWGLMREGGQMPPTWQATLEVGGTFVRMPLLPSARGASLELGLLRAKAATSFCAHPSLPAVKCFGSALTSRHTGWLDGPGRVSGRGVQSGRFLGVGRASCRPPPARVQGPHCCSQQLGEISAAVGCQFSGWDGRGGRGGWAPGQECLNRVGL